MTTLKKLKFYFQIVCTIGLIVSCYALYVETQAEKDKEYKAYCDISEKISCTKAFSSRWGKGFGLVKKVFGEDSVLNQPNSIYGIFFYLIMVVLNLRDGRTILKVQIVLGILSNLMSIYLGNILYSELQDVCVVCIGTYILNATVLAMCSVKWSLLKCPKCSCATAKSKIRVKAKSE